MDRLGDGRRKTGDGRQETEDGRRKMDILKLYTK